MASVIFYACSKTLSVGFSSDQDGTNDTVGSSMQLTDEQVKSLHKQLSEALPKPLTPIVARFYGPTGNFEMMKELEEYRDVYYFPRMYRRAAVIKAPTLEDCKVTSVRYRNVGPDPDYRGQRVFKFIYDGEV